MCEQTFSQILLQQFPEIDTILAIFGNDRLSPLLVQWVDDFLENTQSINWQHDLQQSILTEELETLIPCRTMTEHTHFNVSLQSLSEILCCCFAILLHLLLFLFIQPIQVILEEVLSFLLIGNCLPSWISHQITLHLPEFDI